MWNTSALLAHGQCYYYWDIYRSGPLTGLRASQMILVFTLFHNLNRKIKYRPCGGRFEDRIS